MITERKEMNTLPSLGKHIAYYRKQKGLSQEKLAEQLGISRQAVTKWENDASKPSSENLLKLSEILDVKVEQLLGAEKEISTPPILLGKGSWICFVVSIISIIFYIISSWKFHSFSIGILACVLTIAIPVQLFLHLYFSNAIQNSCYTGIAGYDSGTVYNDMELKKLLVKIDHHIGMSSSVYVMFMCLLGSGMAGKVTWTEYLLFLYIGEFISAILILNYQAIDRIYTQETDKVRARAGFPIIICYLLVTIFSIIAFLVCFTINDISNNSLPALKLAGWLVAGIGTATVGMLRECSRLKKWNSENEYYCLSKCCKICYGISLICLLLMFF